MKMIKKIIKIEDCAICPHLEWDWRSDKCSLKGNKKIKDIKIIQKWCPSEDYK